MAQLLKGHTYNSGDLVDAPDLNALVDAAIAALGGGLITEQPGPVAAVAADSILISDFSDSGKLKKALISSMPGAGTVTNVSWDTGYPQPTSVLTGSVQNNSTTPQLRLSFVSKNGNKVLVSPADGSSGAPSFRAMVPADITPAVVNIAAFIIDLTLGNVFSKTLTANGTFQLNNGVSGQRVLVWVQQTPAGTALIHWNSSGSIRWPGGTEPVLTTGVSKVDVYEFVCMGGNNYSAIRWGANMV